MEACPERSRRDGRWPFSILNLRSSNEGRLPGQQLAGNCGGKRAESRQRNKSRQLSLCHLYIRLYRNSKGGGDRTSKRSRPAPLGQECFYRRRIDWRASFYFNLL